MWVQSLGREDPLEKEMATHSSILVWEIPWTEEPGGLQAIGLHRVRPDWSDVAKWNTGWDTGFPPGFLRTLLVINRQPLKGSRIAHLGVNKGSKRLVLLLSEKVDHFPGSEEDKGDPLLSPGFLDAFILPASHYAVNTRASPCPCPPHPPMLSNIKYLVY